MDGTGNYLNEIGRWPLLTAAQEIILARLHQKGLQVRREIGNEKPTKAQRHTMRVGDRAGRRIVMCNLRLAVSLAKGYTHHCRLNDLDDLIQYAAIGLQRAAAKFDPERGYKFSTYASKWIRQEVGRGIYNTDPVVYMPEKRQMQWTRLGKKAAAFAQRHGRNPTERELLDGTGITHERYREITAVMLGRISLDVPVGEGGETFGQLLPSGEDQPMPISDYSRLMQCIDGLSEKDRELIAKRYGLGNNHPHTLTEIGAEIGVSHEAIRLRVARVQKQLLSAMT
jgi:RNA polymerase primary sigma factor